MRPRPYDLNPVHLMIIDLNLEKMLNYMFPYFDLLTSSKFSFPSGHYTRTITMLNLFSSIFRKYYSIFIIFSTLILLSRLILGAHYPLDLLGGLFLGLISAHVSRFLIQLINNDFK